MTSPSRRPNRRTASDSSGRTRRRFLAATGAGGAAALAGCTTESDDGSPSSDSEPSVPYQAAATAIDDHPGTEPVGFSGSHQCPVCTMSPADYPGWACQLAHEDGTGLFFESPGCLLAYVVVPRSHPTDASIGRTWFVDARTRELFDAGEGYLVRETALDEQRGPMRGSPVPFGTEERAVAYVDDADHLDSDAILAFDDVDYALAEFYRGNRMPDEGA